MTEILYWAVGLYYLTCCAICATLAIFNHRQGHQTHLTTRDHAIVGSALIIFSPITLTVVIYQILKDLSE